MNYRHHYHAGNFADVMKHAALVRIVDLLQRKQKGFLAVDTHSGRGSYDLSAAETGTSLARSPEWPSGVGRLWSAVDLPAPLLGYLERVRAYDRAQGSDGRAPRFYPGSPILLGQMVREQDRLVLFERHPDECAQLMRCVVGRRVRVEEADGYSAAAALFPPRERRGFMLIDPPFEDRDEWARIARCVGTALERFPSAVIAVWYPISERADRGTFLDHWAGGVLPPTLQTELIVDPAGAGLRGCGLLVFNPPWGLDGELREVMTYLARALEVSPPATATLSWPIPEKP